MYHGTIYTIKDIIVTLYNPDLAALNNNDDEPHGEEIPIPLHKFFSDYTSTTLTKEDMKELFNDVIVLSSNEAPVPIIRSRSGLPRFDPLTGIIGHSVTKDDDRTASPAIYDILDVELRLVNTRLGETDTSSFSLSQDIREASEEEIGAAKTAGTFGGKRRVRKTNRKKRSTKKTRTRSRKTH
jgi:hypothetical protein